MEEKNELTAKEALMNQMANAYEQTQRLLEEPDLSDEELKKAKEFNKIFLDCYDRFARDEAHIDELNVKYQEMEAEAAKSEKEREDEALRAEKEDRQKKLEMKISIATVIVSSAVTIGVAIVSGKHANRIALVSPFKISRALSNNNLRVAA